MKMCIRDRIPGARHLWGLKEVLYDKPYFNDETGYTLPAFSLADQMNVDFEIELQGEQAIFDLFSMTPYFWKTPRDSAARLKNLQRLKTPISFRILSYEKT